MSIGLAIYPLPDGLTSQSNLGYAHRESEWISYPRQSGQPPEPTWIPQEQDGSNPGLVRDWMKEVFDDEDNIAEWPIQDAEDD